MRGIKIKKLYMSIYINQKTQHKTKEDVLIDVTLNEDNPEFTLPVEDLELLDYSKGTFKLNDIIWRSLSKNTGQITKVPVEMFFYALREKKIKEFKVLLCAMSIQTNCGPKQRRKRIVRLAKRICNLKDNRSINTKLDWLISNNLLDENYEYCGNFEICEKFDFNSESLVLNFEISHATIICLQEISFCIVEQYLLWRYNRHHKDIIKAKLKIKDKIVNEFLENKRSSPEYAVKSSKKLKGIKLIDNYINDFGFSYSFIANVLNLSIETVYKIAKNAESLGFIKQIKSDLYLDKRKEKTQLADKMMSGLVVEKMMKNGRVNARSFAPTPKQQNRARQIEQEIINGSHYKKCCNLKTMRIHNLKFTFETSDEISYITKKTDHIIQEIEKDINNCPESNFAKFWKDENEDNTKTNRERVDFIWDSFVTQKIRMPVLTKNPNWQLEDYLGANEREKIDEKNNINEREVVHWFLDLSISELFDLGWFEFEKRYYKKGKYIIRQPKLRAFILDAFKKSHGIN